MIQTPLLRSRTTRTTVRERCTKTLHKKKIYIYYIIRIDCGN